MEKNVLDIALDDNGKTFLKRIYFWTKFFYICSIISCFLNFLNSYLYLKFYFNLPESDREFSYVQAFTDTCFVIVYATLLPIQAYYFFKFSKWVRMYINLNDTEGFNRSFKWLLKHAFFAAILFLLNSVYLLINAYFAAVDTGIF